MRIELLFIEDCPGMSGAEEMIQKELRDQEVHDAQIERVLVGSFAQAEEFKFLGSPTIRVNGKDIEPDTSRSNEYELACRVYKVKGRTQDHPDIKWLRDAIKKAKKIDDEKAEKTSKGKGHGKYGAKPLPKPKGIKTFKETKKAKEKK